ncbi:MAG TPA: hypothetical protein VGX02_07935 [Candidatus Eremiobacteraceae bacterium]|jgi:hypothetical protein|nr:hypothetical protein [Candidatus Eremiobacteraceae bacterium]
MDTERTEAEKRATDKLHHAEADVKDATKEVEHRVAAGAEKVKRAIAGDAMTTAEKAGSVIKEAGHKVAAEADKTKRELRDKLEK